MSTSQSTVSSTHTRRESGMFRTYQDRRSVSIASADTLVSAGRSQLTANSHQRNRHISLPWIKLLVNERSSPKANATTRTEVPKCVSTIIAAAESLTGWCQLSDNIAMFQEAWDLKLYENNEAIFPLANVPNKAYVLSELVELLKRHQASDYHISLEHIATALLRLQKVLEGDNCSSIPSNDSLEISSIASTTPQNTIGSGTPPYESPGEERLQTDDSLATTRSRSTAATESNSSNSSKPAPGRMICTFAGTFPADYSRSLRAERSLTVRSLHSFRKSLLYGLSLKKRQSRPISASEAIDPNPTSRTDQHRPPSIHERPSEDLRAMSIYQAQLPRLAHSLAGLPQAQQSLVLFAFLESVVCPFILEDCQALLASCVKAHILDKL